MFEKTIGIESQAVMCVLTDISKSLHITRATFHHQIVPPRGIYSLCSQHNTTHVTSSPYQDGRPYLKESKICFLGLSPIHTINEVRQ